jgi:hypothetical protein
VIDTGMCLSKTTMRIDGQEEPTQTQKAKLAGIVNAKNVVELKILVKFRSWCLSLADNYPLYECLFKKKVDMKNKLVSLYITGFFQVYFVAINTYFIAKGYVIGIAVVSFLISLIWSYNVKKIAFGTQTDRVVYSFGASMGGTLGYFFAKIILP